ncbi:MAG: 4-hydroxybenzoate polyprenyltransferase [Candidatus Endobugula sp.]|jgi:4-hydroxybenzoate polyprenyltransferase
MIRGVNLLIVGLTQYFCAIFLLKNGDWQSVFMDMNFFILVSSTVVITSAGYLINDYYDIKIDFVNRPERVVVGKTLKRRWIIIAHTFLNFLGISLGFWISNKIGIINFAAAFLLWLYSNQLKRLPLVGNFTIAILTGTTLFLVGQYFQERVYLVLCYAVFSGFITLVREIIKDMEDMKGDEKFGCKTLPIVIGIRKTKRVILAILLTFGVTVFFLMSQINLLLPIILSIVLILLIFVILKADTKRAYHQLSAFCKWIMIAGVVSMIWI